MSDSLRLEGFDGAVRGRRVCIFGSPDAWLARVAQLESESLYKGRTILVSSGPPRAQATSLPPALLRKRWDAIFTPRENFDFQMLLTYVQNAPKPVRVCWHCAPGVSEIPRAVWSKWTAAKAGGTPGGSGATDVTLIGLNGPAPEGGDLWAVEWDAIMFPLEASASFVEKVLARRGTGQRALLQGIAGHLDDIRSGGAALVWSNIDETDGRGTLYWYDPSEGVETGVPRLGMAEAAAMLEDVRRLLLGNP